MVILGAGASCGLAIIAGSGATLTYAHREYSDVLAKWEMTNAKVDATNAKVDATNAKVDATNAKMDATNAKMDAYVSAKPKK